MIKFKPIAALLVSCILSVSNASAVQLFIIVDPSIDQLTQLGSNLPKIIFQKLDYQLHTGNIKDGLIVSKLETEFGAQDRKAFSEIIELINSADKHFSPLNTSEGDYFRLTLGYEDMQDGRDNIKWVFPTSCNINLQSNVAHIVIGKDGCQVS